jgi:hypothetical protein
MLATTLLTAGMAGAAADQAVRAGNLQSMAAWTQAEQKRCAGDTNCWIAPGVVANRTAGTVTVMAEATGLAPAAIAEFLAVSLKSEKDYEALTISLADAADIARGIEFLGVPHGRPIRPARCQFWPRGERVQAFIRPFGRESAGNRPLARCIRDQREHPAPWEGFIYVGTAPTADTGAAEQTGAGAWISTYNEPSVLLDVPYYAPQGEVYGNLVVAETGRFERGALLLLTITPDPLSNNVPRVLDVALAVTAGTASTNTATLTELRGVLQTAGSRTATTNDLKSALEELATLTRSGREPFVTLTLDPAFSAGTARELARVLKMVEGSGGLRIEPPPPGQPYYKAFLPDERWRKRETRPSQPWEVRVSPTPQGNWRCTLVQILEDWSKEGQLTPDLTPTDFPLDRPEEFLPKIDQLIAAQSDEVRRKLTQSGKIKQLEYIEPLLTLKRINALFVFTPPNAPLGAFFPVIQALQERLPQIYIFVE